MALSKNSPKSTDIIMRQGHTEGPFGMSPHVDAKGAAGRDAKDLKI